jgi:hypothetical protein
MEQAGQFCELPIQAKGQAPRSRGIIGRRVYSGMNEGRARMRDAGSVAGDLCACGSFGCKAIGRKLTHSRLSFGCVCDADCWRRVSGRTSDGTNSRWRLGVAPCFEVLVDLPNYISNIKSPGISGFSDVAPAIKWHISPVPGKIHLSMTMGMLFPTGPVEIAGRGAQPYLQFSLVIRTA